MFVSLSGFILCVLGIIGSIPIYSRIVMRARDRRFGVQTQTMWRILAVCSPLVMLFAGVAVVEFRELFLGSLFGVWLTLDVSQSYMS